VLSIHQYNQEPPIIIKVAIREVCFVPCYCHVLLLFLIFLWLEPIKYTHKHRRRTRH
jgi:hypothetical protein